MKIGIAGPLSIHGLKNYLDVEDQYLSYGLGATGIDNIIKGLLEKGHHVSAYTLATQTDKPMVFRGKSLTIYMGTYRNRGRSRMMDLFNFEAMQIKRFIQEDKPEIVHAHWTYEFALGTIKSKFPHLITFHDNAWIIFKIFKDPYRAIRLLLDKMVRLNGKNFSVISPYLRDSIPLPSEKLPIVPLPFPEKYIVDKSKSIPVGRPIKIITISNGWSPRKNPTTGVKAFRLLQSLTTLPVEYHIYGRDCSINDPSYLWIKENGYDKNLFMYGEVPYATLMAKLPEYDIMLHPSLEESFGNNLVEAMACGMPVVAGKDAGAVPWVLNEGRNGVLVDVKSENSIAEGLLSLIEDKELYESISVNGIERVKEMFSSSAVTDRYIALYEKIIADTSRQHVYKVAAVI